MNIRHKLAAIFLLSLLVLGGGGYFLSYMYSKGDALFISEADRVYFVEKPTIVPSVTLNNAKSGSSHAGKSNSDNNILPEIKTNSLTETSGIGSSYSSTSGMYSSRGSAFGAKSRKDETISSTSGGSSSGLMAYGGSRRSSGGYGGSSGGSGGMMGGTSGYSSPAAFVPMFNNNTTTSIPPSGDPDPGEMIPVGDGLWFILALAGAYALLRRKN